MFLCAPPFIMKFGFPAGYYEFDITIGASGAGRGYYEGLYGSISDYSDIFKGIQWFNGSDSAYVWIKPDSPVLPDTGHYINTTILSGASSTGQLNNTAYPSYFYGFWAQDYSTTWDMNSSGTASFIIEFTPA